uniref:Uncharacterized protein n=1 Tax=Bionectria ochroleuca TaxID=29856 RepID=A0A8H7NN35_BIOOC
MIAGALNGGMRRWALANFGAGLVEQDQTECCNLSFSDLHQQTRKPSERVSMRSIRWCNHLRSLGARRTLGPVTMQAEMTYDVFVFLQCPRAMVKHITSSS